MTETDPLDTLTAAYAAARKREAQEQAEMWERRDQFDPARWTVTVGPLPGRRVPPNGRADPIRVWQLEVELGLRDPADRPDVVPVLTARLRRAWACGDWGGVYAVRREAERWQAAYDEARRTR